MGTMGTCCSRRCVLPALVFGRVRWLFTVRSGLRGQGEFGAALSQLWWAKEPVKRVLGLFPQLLPEGLSLQYVDSTFDAALLASPHSWFVWFVDRTSYPVPMPQLAGEPLAEALQALIPFLEKQRERVRVVLFVMLQLWTVFCLQETCRVSSCPQPLTNYLQASPTTMMKKMEMAWCRGPRSFLAVDRGGVVVPLVSCFPPRCWWTRCL